MGARAGAAPAALAAPKLDASRPADEPLSPDEVEEMRRHLRFLHGQRHALRLKVNAAEDLLLNGAREPTDRGICRHLLSKVDLPAVQSALARASDAAAKGRLLSGVVRFSSDTGILLLFVEHLAESASSREAAAALSAALARIDFGTLSDARVVKILEIVAERFDEDERVQLLFSLLRNTGFRDRFDHARLPGALAALFLPLRAVHHALFGDDAAAAASGAVFDRGLVEEGARRLLRAPIEVIVSYPAEVRRRLLERAALIVKGAERIDPALDALLDSFPRASRAFADLALVRAAGLLARHQDGQARQRLQQIRKAHPDARTAARWLEILDLPRVGRVAVRQPAPRPAPPGASAPAPAPTSPSGPGLPGEPAVAAVAAVPSPIAPSDGPGEVAPASAGDEPAPASAAVAPAVGPAPAAAPAPPLAPAPPPAPRLRSGFWLDGQRPVWMATGAAGDAEAFERAAALHRGLTIAGIAPLLGHGRADDGTPYAVVPALSAQPLDGPRAPEPADLFEACIEGVRILHTLARLGLALPDGEPGRFLLRRGGALWLADLAGLEASADALARGAASAAALCEALAPRLAAADREQVLPIARSQAGLEEMARRLSVL